MQETSALASMVDRSFVDAWRRLAEREHGVRARFGGIEVAATGLPASFFNPIFVFEPPALDELQAAVSALRAAGLPFVVHVHRAFGETVRAAAMSLHLREEGVLPGMAMRLPVEIPPSPPGLEIGLVTDAAGYEAFIAVTAEGFEMPVALAAEAEPARLFGDAVRGYVASIDGEAVAVSVAIQTGDAVGIYGVATRPAHRGAGFGSAVSWHAIAEADTGTPAAVLQSSDMGRGVYERMGFRTVVEYLEFEGGP